MKPVKKMADELSNLLEELQSAKDAVSESYIHINGEQMLKSGIENILEKYRLGFYSYTLKNKNYIDAIKEKIDIAEFIKEYAGLEMEERGNHYKSKCPFCKDDCFTVNKKYDFYHCFCCGVGGDVFTFVEEYKGIDFKESFKEVVDYYKKNGEEIK